VTLRLVLLRSLDGLSDAQIEEVVADRLSFSCIAGHSLGDRVPDYEPPQAAIPLMIRYCTTCDIGYRLFYDRTIPLRV
jgi:hypothetical protein